MKVSAAQLESSLQQNLAPVYVISGDEPLLVDEALQALREAAREQGYTERETHVTDARFDWSAVAAGFQNLSLFAERKLVELRIPTGKPGREGGDFLQALVAEPPADTVVVVVLPNLDNRTLKTKWASRLTGDAVWLPLKSVAPAQLPGWIVQRARRAGMNCDKDAALLLAERTEGNLLAARQELDKLALLCTDGNITLDAVRDAVADGARFDVFQLADAAIELNAARVLRVLRGLHREGVAAPLVLWALVREVNQISDLWMAVAAGASPNAAMNSARIWRNRQQVTGRCLKAHSAGSIRNLLTLAAAADRVVKGAAPGQPWNVLQDLALALARPGAPA